MSSIGSIGGNSSMMTQGIRPPRPTAEQTTQMAENLFSKLDTSGQGYLTKADLQSAMDGTSSATSSSNSTSVDDLFSKLDGDSDGKVTKQEFSDTLKQIAEQLDSQAMRANGGMQGSSMGGGMSGMGGMPPPPPPPDGGSGDSGFTKDELTSQLSEIGSSDSNRSSLISNIVNNFDEADSDGNGKVSFQEAMAYDQSSSASSSSTSSSSSGSASTNSSNDVSNQVLQQIMKLMQAYSLGGDQSGTLLSTLSVSA